MATTLAFGSAGCTVIGPMDELVLAVTTRECIALRGFSSRIELGMLESIQEETWFAQPAIIRHDPLAAEVRLVMLFQHADHVLIDEHGRFAADQPVLPEAFAAGRGLPGLKRHVQGLALARVGRPCGCELAGYAFNPVDQPHLFFLVYRCRVLPAAGSLDEAPDGCGSWVPSSALDRLIHLPHERWFIPVVAR